MHRCLQGKVQDETNISLNICIIVISKSHNFHDFNMTTVRIEEVICPEGGWENGFEDSFEQV